MEGSRVPPRENNDGENNDGVLRPHQCSRADSRLLRGISTGLDRDGSSRGFDEARVQRKLFVKIVCHLVWFGGVVGVVWEGEAKGMVHGMCGHVNMVPMHLFI